MPDNQCSICCEEDFRGDIVECAQCGRKVNSKHKNCCYEIDGKVICCACLVEWLCRGEKSAN